MITKYVKLWIGSPQGAPPVIRLSQYDTDWKLVFTLYNGDSVYNVTVERVLLLGRREDGTVITVEGEPDAPNAYVILPSVFTAVPGTVSCELRVSREGVFSSANFALEIEESPINEHGTSKDDFDGLNQLINRAMGAADEAVTAAAAAQVTASYQFALANQVADMTDGAKAYVYIGNPSVETGYTRGAWYYKDGNDWVLGGLATDTTHLVSGAAADSKATGDKLDLIGRDARLNRKIIAGSALTWQLNRSFATATGLNYQPGSSTAAYNKRIRSDLIPERSHAVAATDPAYLFSLFAWDRQEYAPNANGGSEAGYIGQWTGSAWEKSNLAWHSFVDLKATDNYGDYVYRLVVKKVNTAGVEQTLTTADGVGIELIMGTDVSMTKTAIAADAARVGEYMDMMRRGLFPVERKANTASGYFSVVSGGLTEADGKKVSSSYALRTYHITVDTDPGMHDHFMVLDDTAYEWLCWTYDFHNENDNNAGLRMLTPGYVGAEEAILYQYAPESHPTEIALRFSFRRKDGAAMTIDLTDSTSDAYKIQRALHLYTLYNAQEEDSSLQGYSYLPVADIPLNALAYHAQYDDLVTAGWLTRTKLAVSNNDEDLPIYLYSLQNDKDHLIPDYSYSQWTGGAAIYERPRIMIDSGMHGNERSTPQALCDFIHRLCNDPRYQSLRNAFDWFFIPLVCPWGFSHTGLKSGGSIAIGDNLRDIDSVVENSSSYHQGIRRLPGGTLGTTGEDPNRDFHTRLGVYAENTAVKYAGVALTGIGSLTAAEEALVDSDAITAAAGAWSGTPKRFAFWLDAHQASMETGAKYTSPTPNPTAPAISGFMSMDAACSDDIKNKAYSKLMQAGAIVEKLLDKRFNKPHVQSVYPWGPGSSSDVIRNYVIGMEPSNDSYVINPDHQFADFSMTFEGTQTAYYYSGSTTWSNKTAQDVVNTTLQTFLRFLCQHWM